MAIDPVRDRRRFLRALSALAASGSMPALAGAQADAGRDLVATWRLGIGHQAGLLRPYRDGGLAIVTAFDLPGRAHGLAPAPGGGFLTVARRPGDWLARWHLDGRPPRWRWIEPGRAFSGHVLAAGDFVFTTETDLETGAGLIGARDPETLEKRAEWPTLGIDAHELIDDAGRPGCLLVANGGVPTRPETGRIKHDLARMSSSLVRLDARTGRPLGQWRLTDPRLSIRHLAWNGDRLGIALQAEHDDAADRARAPVLAWFDGDVVGIVPTTRPLAGYGGGVAAFSDGFAVSCPRAGGIALFGAGGLREFLPLAEACPLAGADGRLLAGGADRVFELDASMPPRPRSAAVGTGIRLDNHWLAWPLAGPA